MVLIAAVIAKELQRLILAHHYYVQVAVVIIVPDREPAGDPWVNEVAQRVEIIHERPVGLSMEELLTLSIGGTGSQAGGVVQHMPIAYNQVLVAVQVVVKTLQPKPEELKVGIRNIGRVGSILKETGAAISQNRFGLTLEVHNHQIFAAVIVVIPYPNAHSRVRRSGVSHGYACEKSSFRKRSVAVVMQQKIRQSIIRQEKIHPAIAIVVYPRSAHGFGGNR